MATASTRPNRPKSRAVSQNPSTAGALIVGCDAPVIASRTTGLDWARDSSTVRRCPKVAQLRLQ
jgi:ABC-type Fe2+-enterobactin transport system substrate-binding protein